MPFEPGQAGYWNELYLAGSAGWDRGRVAPPIERLLQEGLLPAGARVVVLGAGLGHEAICAARLGFATTGVDFAPEAAKAMRVAAERESVALEVLVEDLFDLPRLRPAGFEAVIEHTCFCALPIENRSRYVGAIAELLAPGGLLLGLFYAHGKPGGPPFDVTESEVRALFSSSFQLERLRRAPDSFENRRDKELEFVFRKS